MTANSVQPWLDDGDLTLYHGDALTVLQGLPAGIAQTCVTSPPYWGLRDYGTGQWSGGDEACDHLDPDWQARVKNSPKQQTSNGSYDRQELQTCRRCGARRVDSQLGLEATPTLYVQNMVNLFREVWRVLRDDGTLWLNLGDSYAGSWGAQSRDGADTAEGAASQRIGAAPESLSANQIAAHPKRKNTGSIPPGSGLKPKDLVGIPWQVAFALQQPYYAGTIKDERDRLWLAAMIDTEGSIGINLQRGGDHRPNDVYSVSIKVHNCSERLIRRCAEIAGMGSVALAESRRRPVYVWSVYGATARALLRELYPHFVAKQHEARLAYSHEGGIGAEARARYEALRLLHAGRDANVDQPEPPSCFEAGWYLRSDIIWAKPNPMPESVTDRPTKAHEYLFLFSKQPRYFYDADAIREPHQPDGRGVTTRTVANGSHDNYQEFGHEEGRERWPGAGRNRRSVWTIPTQPFPEAHFATYPEELVRPCILAGTSEKGECSTCGKPWIRQTEAEYVKSPVHGAGSVVGRHYETGANGWDGSGMPRLDKKVTTTGWEPSCDCRDTRGSGVPVPQLVLDPFIGSGTTSLVARKHGRRSIGIDLSTEYLAIAAKRTQQLSLLGGVA